MAINPLPIIITITWAQTRDFPGSTMSIRLTLADQYLERLDKKNAKKIIFAMLVLPSIPLSCA